MDNYIAPSLSRSEEVSAFGDMDARYIGNAVRSLKKPGDLVIVEAQPRALRDHYVKQVLSQLMALSPSIVVKRCKKDRDWMIAAINQALDEGKKNKQIEPRNIISEVWILELNSPENLSILRLAHTLVSQFREANVCMLVSCSSSITSRSDFVEWTNRAEIPVWQFEVPDSSAMDSFLERHAEIGAVNLARRLVDDLKRVESEDEKAGEMADFYSLTHQPGEEASLDIPLNEHIRPEGVLVNIDSVLASPLGEDATPTNNRESEERTANGKGVANGKFETIRSFFRIPEVTLFGCLILFMSAAVVLVISANRSHFDLLQDHLGDYPKVLSTYFLLPEKDEKPSEAVSNLAADNIDMVLPKTELTEISSAKSTPVNTAMPPSINLSVESEKEQLVSRVSPSPLVETLSAVAKGDTKPAIWPKTQLVQESSSMPAIAPAVRDENETIQYYAQIGAFNSREGAAWWKVTNEDKFSDTFIVEKTSGLWAVVLGPYDSQELAKFSQEDTKNDVYVVPGWDLKIN